MITRKILLAVFITGGVLAALLGLVPFFLGNSPPLRDLMIEPAKKYGYAPVDLVANGSKSSDPDGDPLSYAWKLNGDLQEEQSALLERRLSAGGKYRLEFFLSDTRHKLPAQIELIHVLPPLKDLEITPLREDTVIHEPNVTLVLPPQIVTNGFGLTIKAGGIKADNTAIVSYPESDVRSGPDRGPGSDGGNGGGGGRNGGDGGNGAHGANGAVGADGATPKAVEIQTDFLAGALMIKNVGQNGGDGGRGGDGGDGGDGANGRNRGGDAFCTNDRSPGNGGDAGSGGNGGRGGDAGAGGDGGKVVIDVDEMDARIDIDVSPGIAGEPGQAGIPGTAGSRGDGGRSSHCGGGGDNGASKSDGADLDVGSKASNGRKGSITVIDGGVSQDYDVSTASIQRQRNTG